MTVASRRLYANHLLFAASSFTHSAHFQGQIGWRYNCRDTESTEILQCTLSRCSPAWTLSSLLYIMMWYKMDYYACHIHIGMHRASAWCLSICLHVCPALAAQITQTDSPRVASDAASVCFSPSVWGPTHLFTARVCRDNVSGYEFTVPRCYCCAQ